MDTSYIQAILGGQQSPPNTPLGQAMASDPMDFSQRYNTELSPQEEQMFLQWAKENNRLNDTYDYDIKGAWKDLQAGQMSQADNGHLGDKYKKPNHPTFSNESVYHNKDGYMGGAWGQDPTGRYTYTPPASHMWGPEELQRYFSTHEKDSVLSPRR